MTPPRFPLDPASTHAVSYVVAILRALHEASGNTEAAATALGMSRRTLDDHISRLGLRDLQSALWSRSVRQPRRQGQPG